MNTPQLPGYSIRVVNVYKPNQAVTTATVTLDVIGTCEWDTVLDAALAAMHERRDSLFGYGIYGHRAGDEISNELVTVYAHRE